MKKVLLSILVLVIAAGITYFLLRWRETSGATRPTGQVPSGMVWIPGGEFLMGSDDPMSWQEERPAHQVRVHGFWMDEHEVTNREFSEFVKATGYVTDAEKAPKVEDI